MSLWFAQSVFRWRAIASCVWLLILSFPCLCFGKATAEILMWQPWTILPSPRNALFLLVYLSLLVAINVIYSLTFTAKLPVFKTRLEALCNVFDPEHFLVSIIFSAVGVVCAWCLNEFLGYSSGFWHFCEIDRFQRNCLNEHQFFSAVFGAVFGFCYGCSYFYNKEYFLVFPSIQKNKWFRLHGHLTSHLWEGFMWTLKVLRVFYPLYYFCGSSLRVYFLNVSKLVMSEETPLDSVSGLLDVSLLIHLISVGTFMFFSWSFALRLFRIYQTQTLVFPVVATFSDDSFRLLEDALQSDLLLLKLLGFLDLYQLSLHSPQRRRQVFSLTATGQPLIWNSVCNECLKLITELTERLSVGRRMLATQSPDTSSIGSSDGSPGAKEEMVSKGWPPLSAEDLGSPGSTRRRVFNEKARLWSYSPGNPVETVPVYRPKERNSVTALGINQLKSSISSFPKLVCERLKRKPFFIYFLSELPDMVNQELFSDCQLQVWAVTSISQLAVASYTEDTYGVVQRSLCPIIESLIDLSQVLDKHVKAPLSSAKSTRNVRVALEANGKYAIKTAVQTALFQLAATFSRERRSIYLSPNHQVYWNRYFTDQQ